LIPLKKVLLPSLLFCCLSVQGQLRFSLATDVSAMRQLGAGQGFWSVGHSIQGNVHFSQRQTAYASVSYYLPGRYQNEFIAPARSLLTRPEQQAYTLRASISYTQFSLGLRHYFKGSFDSETGFNLYGTAGFGLQAGRFTNSLQSSIDTTVYDLQPRPLLASQSIKRLTLDLGLGAEVPVNHFVFLYADLRTWIPTSNYPYAVLHKREAPLPLIGALGIRILFSYTTGGGPVNE
jgi:opacity protein-like surface antigen